MYSPCLYCIVFSAKKNALLYFLRKIMFYYFFCKRMLYIQVTANLCNVFLIVCYISSSSWIHQELVSIPLTGLIPQPCCVCLSGVALVFVVLWLFILVNVFLLNWNRIVNYFHDRTWEKKVWWMIDMLLCIIPSLIWK